MGKFTDDSYEASFHVDADVEAVWKRLQESENGEPLWLGAFPRFGAERTGEITMSEAPRHVEALKTSEPCKDTSIAIHLESEDNGTRVLVVQSGFPAYVKDSLETFEIGGDQIIADLALYLTRGVRMSRHGMPWAFAGLTTDEVDTGLTVRSVMPGTFAERVGIESGDLLMTLGDAPVFTQLCLQALLRVFKTGELLKATWVRGEKLQEGEAQL